MTIMHVCRRLLPLTGLALAGALAGCVAYPGYPAYGYGYGPAYAAPCCAVVAIGGGGWHGGGWGGGYGGHYWR